jgi:hypothetical protein
MRSRFKAALTASAAVVLAAAALAPVAGANGMMGSPSPSPSMMATPAPTSPATMMPGPAPSPSPGTSGTGWCAGGMWGGAGSWGGTGMWGTGYGMTWLASDPDALAAWTQLRAGHQQAMRAWLSTYRTGLQAPAAQQALHDLWTGYWDNMKAFYEQYADGAAWTSPTSGMWSGWRMGGMMGGSWDPGHMWGTGYGASWMMGHPGALGAWLTMRHGQIAAVTAWQQHYMGSLTGDAALAAMKALHTHQRAQIRSFYVHHGLAATTARMRYGSGGWMGLGGMWGGWGW